MSRLPRRRPALPRQNLWPLLDRIDIDVGVPAVQYKDISSNIPGESSESIRNRIESASEVQHRRHGKTSKSRSNSRMTNEEIKRHRHLDEPAEQL